MGAKEIVKYLNYIGSLNNCLKHPTRLKIIDLIKKVDKPLNIRDIWKRLNKDQKIPYKTVYKHTLILEDYGLVKLTQDLSSSGQAKTVDYTPPKKELAEIYEKVKNELTKKQSNK